MGTFLFLFSAINNDNALPIRGSLRGPGISLNGFASVRGAVAKDLVPHPDPVGVVLLVQISSLLVTYEHSRALLADQHRVADMSDLLHISVTSARRSEWPTIDDISIPGTQSLVQLYALIA